MKKHRKLLTLLICLLSMFAGQAFSITETLRPNATGTYQEWDIFGTGSPRHYVRTSDISDVTGVQLTGDEVSKETENLADPILSATIDSVIAYIRATATGTHQPERAVVICRTYNTDYENVTVVPNISRTGFSDYYTLAMTTNPNTGLAWTKDEITNLEVGLRASTLDAGETIQCSEIWIVVYCTPTLSISVTSLSWPLGMVDAATIQTSTSGNNITITNDGGAPETFTLQVVDEDNYDEWTASTSENGAGTNVYVFSGIFCATTDAPDSSNFNEGTSDDVIITASQTATSTTYGYAGGTGNGVSVPAFESRSLWFRLDMPTAVSGTYLKDQHAITIRIGCQ